MKLHKEGTATIIITLLVLTIINYLVFVKLNIVFIPYILLLLSIGLYFVILYFFRKPNRIPQLNEKQVIAPADGKLVVIEEIKETEYFNDRRKQVSIFMSPLNVHINWAPISGQITYYKYHPGKHMVAWHPKSSTDNERTTTVIKNEKGVEIMVRQIAGAVARRIVCYSKVNNEVKQGDELGFIKFGSRVDIILPLETEIKVNLDQKITGNNSILAEFN